MNFKNKQKKSEGRAQKNVGQLSPVFLTNPTKFVHIIAAIGQPEVAVNYSDLFIICSYKLSYKLFL